MLNFCILQNLAPGLMKFCIKHGRYGKIALITEQGHALAYFSSITQALVACDEWYMVNGTTQENRIEKDVQPLHTGLATEFTKSNIGKASLSGLLGSQRQGASAQE